MAKTATKQATVEDYLTPKEAALKIGISRSHLVYLENNGKIAAVRVGLGRLFAPSEVERYRLSRESAPRRGRRTRAQVEADGDLQQVAAAV